MQFKRWRLSATSPVVNAGLGLALLFTAVGCSKKAEAPEVPASASEIAAGVELPAVWSTRPLEGKVNAVALSGGLGGLLAVAYERGGQTDHVGQDVVSVILRVRLHGARLARSTVQKQEKLENDDAHHDGDGENQMLEMMRVFVADQLSNAFDEHLKPERSHDTTKD